jgi:hypothetical protein
MPSWKRVVVSGSDASLHSLNVTNGITGSLEGTSSYATISSQIQGGKATHIPYFKTDTTLATSSLYQSGSSTVVINQDSATTAAPEALYVWQPHPTSVNVISGKGNLDSFLQLNIQNTSQGTKGSSDIVATANNGSDTTNYIDLGINGENYVKDSTWWVGQSNDTYLVSNGNTHYMGSATGGDIRLFTTGSNFDGDASTKILLRANDHHELSGSFHAKDRFYAEGGATVTGSLLVSGSTTQVGMNTLQGNTLLSGSIGIVGSSTLTGSFLVSGSTTQVGTNNLLGNTNLSGSIQISGSVNALADITMGGVFRLDPAHDPGSLNVTASFLFTSASNTSTGYDLYYRQDGNIVKFKWIEGGISSGLLYGGVVSGSGSTVYVSSGSGIVVDTHASLNQEVAPTFKYVTWPAYSASLQYITSSQNTYLYVTDAGQVTQQTSYFTETQYQDTICLGRVTHANYTAVTGVGSNVQTTYDSDAQQNGFIRAFGPLKITGLTVTGQAGSLRFDVGAGTSYNLGGFYPQNPAHPSEYTSTAALTASFARAYRSGSGIYLDNNGGSFYTAIDPSKYDDGSGTLQTVSSGQYTIKRVFYNPVSKRSTVYYGQTTYNSLLNAQQSLNTDPFNEGEFTAKSLIFVAYIISKGNATDITNTNDCQIIQAGIFRNTAGGSSTSGVTPTNLNDLGDVTITTPTGGQPVVYDSGSAQWINSSAIVANVIGNASTATTASYAITASYALNSIPAFPYTGAAVITGSLQVTQAVSATQGFTGSLHGNADTATSASYATNSTSASHALQADNATNAITAQSGSNFVVTNTLRIDDTLTDYATTNSTIVGTNNLYTQATGSFTAAFCKYTVLKGANARAGEFMTVWNGSTVTYTDTSTTDIGNTSDISFISAAVTGNIQISTVAASSGWTIKTLVTYI